MKTATAKDVHNECDRESEAILKEANLVIEKSKKKDAALMDKLRQMGFENSVSVKEDSEEKISEDLLRYRLLYPQNNFLTEQAIERICKKYGLLFAHSHHFIGEIPLKNQIEMANFKLAGDYIPVLAIDKKKFNESFGEIKKIKKQLKTASWFSAILLVINLVALKNGYQKYITKKEFDDANKNDNNLSFRKTLPPDFRIIATPENISLANKEIVGEYRVVDKDPVVFCRIGSVYIQVSAWGDEASLDEFKTPTKN